MAAPAEILRESLAARKSKDVIAQEVRESGVASGAELQEVANTLFSVSPDIYRLASTVALELADLGPPSPDGTGQTLGKMIPSMLQQHYMDRKARRQVDREAWTSTIAFVAEMWTYGKAMNWHSRIVESIAVDLLSDAADIGLLAMLLSITGPVIDRNVEGKQIVDKLINSLGAALTGDVVPGKQERQAVVSVLLARGRNWDNTMSLLSTLGPATSTSTLAAGPTTGKGLRVDAPVFKPKCGSKAPAAPTTPTKPTHAAAAAAAATSAFSPSASTSTASSAASGGPLHILEIKSPVGNQDSDFSEFVLPGEEDVYDQHIMKLLQDVDARYVDDPGQAERERERILFEAEFDFLN